MDSFVYEALPQRVVFGTGTLAEVGAELDRLGISRALVLSSPGQGPKAAALARAIGARAAGSFAGAMMHSPVEVTEVALAALGDADGLVALGGGSAIGLGKALARRTGLRQLVIPTTYAGSEATPILGETAKGEKTTRRDPRMLPATIVYDVSLTLGLPVAVSMASGLNAIAHAIEARYARERNPLIALLALEAVRALTTALPRIKADPADTGARSGALYGAWAAGTCLGSVGMALHHKLCHVLGGSFGLPHAETHAVLLPHATAYNETVAADLLRPVAELLGAPTAAQGLFALAQSLGAPLSLKALGMPKAGLDRVADATLANPYWNPRPLDRARIRLLLQDAYDGRPPRVE